MSWIADGLAVPFEVVVRGLCERAGEGAIRRALSGESLDNVALQ